MKPKSAASVPGGFGMLLLLLSLFGSSKSELPFRRKRRLSDSGFVRLFCFLSILMRASWPFFGDVVFVLNGESWLSPLPTNCLTAFVVLLNPVRKPMSIEAGVASPSVLLLLGSGEVSASDDCTSSFRKVVKAGFFNRLFRGGWVGVEGWNKEIPGLFSA